MTSDVTDLSILGVVSAGETHRPRHVSAGDNDFAAGKGNAFISF